MPDRRPSTWHPVTVVGRKPSTARHLHFKTRPKRRVPVRAAALTLLVLVVLAGAAVVRAATESMPALTVHRLLPTSVVVAGGGPMIAWPAHGEAALSVQGMPPFGSSGPDSPVPIASLAKIMTAYVVLQDHPLQGGQTGSSITVTAADVAIYQTEAAQQQSVVAVAQGETLTEVQLLQALLVASGNNIAMTAANYDAGSTTAFVAKMNNTAKSLGMTHTSYTDPSGLASTTVSTASDQLLLAAKAMGLPAFAQVVAMPTANLPVAGTVTNFNKAVGTGGYVGVKTGSTLTAGGCLVFANRQTIAGKEITILGVVLGQGAGQASTSALTTAALNAAGALVSSVISAVTERIVVPAGMVVAFVRNASGAKANARISSPLTTVGFGGLAVPIAFVIRPLGSHVSAGGTVASVSAGGIGQAVPVIVESGIPSPSWTWRLSHIF